VRVAKNTLLKRAIEGDEKWSVVGSELEASNMWFFVGSDLKVRGLACFACAPGMYDIRIYR
jgi:ribosomal protein L10